jgi:hypothetical protein
VKNFTKSVNSLLEDPPVHMRRVERMTGLLLRYYWHFCTADSLNRSPIVGTMGRHHETWTHPDGKEATGLCMLLSFQRPPRLSSLRGDSSVLGASW